MNASAAKPGRVYQITALSNPRIKGIRSLALKKHRDETRTFLAEGMKLVRDAVEKGWSVHTLVYSAANAAENPQVSELAAMVRARGGDILEVNEKILASITRRDNPQMVIAVIHQRWQDPPTRLERPETLWVALDRVRDPGNLGTIIRTVDAAGAEGVILVGDTTDPFSLEATRATMGSIFNISLARMEPRSFAQWAGSCGGMVVGTHLAGARDYRSIDCSKKPVILLMGNEQQGLPEALAETCDELALIPMAGSADSLNLAVATGIMLFQIAKRTPLPSGPGETR